MSRNETVLVPGHTTQLAVAARAAAIARISFNVTLIADSSSAVLDSGPQKVRADPFSALTVSTTPGYL
jgi:hypothetical protein